MCRSVWGLCLLLAVVGCKKEESGDEQREFARAYQRLQVSDAPTDFEWPLLRLKELSETSSDADVKYAARFELARGWLRLGILAGVPADRVGADRVLTATGMGEPKNIISHFQAVADSGGVGDTDMATWAADGVKLADGLGLRQGDGTQADRLRLVTEVALSGGAFVPEASAVIFSHMVRLSPPGATLPPARKHRELTQILRYACPEAVALISESGATDLAVFASTCRGAPWFQDVDLESTAAGTPCTNLAPSGDGAEREARAVVGTFFNLLMTAYDKGGAGSAKPQAIYRRFPVQEGCGVAAELVRRLTAPATEEPESESVATDPTEAPAESDEDAGAAGELPAGEDGTSATEEAEIQAPSEQPESDADEGSGAVDAAPALIPTPSPASEDAPSPL